MIRQLSHNSIPGTTYPNQTERRADAKGTTYIMHLRKQIDSQTHTEGWHDHKDDQFARGVIKYDLVSSSNIHTATTDD